MPDVTEKLGKSLIQHGKDSDRIYLMKLDPRDEPTIIGQLEQLAEANDYGKLFCKVPDQAVDAFVRTGYHEEARIPRFFHGQTDVAFMSRFRNSGRRRVSDEHQAAIERALALAEQKHASSPVRSPTNCHIRSLGEPEAPQLAALYRRVFRSYPFPIFDEAYLCETMATHIRYFGTFDDGRLVAAASAETDCKARNAEMTDFATDPGHRQKGLAVALLQAMETYMKAADYATLYTIARAVSIGMNATFARCGYRFGGTLINNTQIAGNIESMNIWYKNLTSSD